MGNTKQFYFEGYAKNTDKQNPFFDPYIEKILIRVAHGDHCVVSIERKGQ